MSMANIIRGKWHADIRLGRDRFRKVSPDGTKKGALAIERIMTENYLRTGSPYAKKPEEDKSDTLFVDFATEWTETYVRTNNKSSEVKRKAAILNNHLVPFFGKLKLGDVTTQTIERFKGGQKSKTFRGKPIGAKTINNHLSVLNKVLKCAHEWGYIKKLPSVQWLKSQAPKIDFLKESEIKKLLSDEKEPRWNLMALMAVRTGMRIGELLALHWEDVDLETGHICIRRNKAGKKIESTKTNQVRYAHMTPSLHQALTTWQLVNNGSLVFTSPANGGALSRSASSEALARTCKRVGLRKIGWHTLRHTFGTDLTAKGIPTRVVQKLMGHSSIKMTERYAHVADETARQAVMTLECEWVTFGHNTDTSQNVYAPRSGSDNAFEA